MIPSDLEPAPPRRRRAQPRQSSKNRSYKPQTGRKPKPGFAYFPRLPLEIRLLIWDLALPGPRILNLHVHVTEKVVKDPRRRLSCRPYPRLLTSVSFTHTILPSSTTIKSQRGHGRGERPRDSKLPRGPSALYTCSESRGVAKRRYQLAFAGKLIDGSIEGKWDRGGFGRKILWLAHFGEKRTWVDFETDVVFLDLVGGWVHRRHPLALVHEFAAEDVGKIQRLGLGDRGNHTQSIPRDMRYFGGLKLLYLWDDFEDTELPLRREDKEVFQQRMVRALKIGKEQDKDWEGELPDLKVMRGADSL